ncbi:hypothetical protein FMEXI_1508 [Fusarium mexicanum]|uniref:DUF7908 domain-containing protein n=1 Tax=Fusarium mexicanum TaxID=751941 RepID=A0A8H5N7A7_9HYPO|nr:hypothetical protein FMEXI_1508 [Fusarium mexicanum]
MKSQTILTTVLGASGVLSQPDHGAMSFDTWCVTYLSTYLVPVANPGKSTGASSLQPTFAGNSSVPVTQTEPQSTLTTDITSEVSTSVEIGPTEAQSGSETVSFDSTTGTLTDQITTLPESIVSTDVLTTSTGIIEPPGRTVIFLISAPNTRKRQNTDKGFVGNDNPSICTFAQSFNLAEEQLFIDGAPFFYDGEDYKELVAGPAPPAGAVTRLFGTNGRALQVNLPGVTAGFCQASDGRIYVTFTSGPVGCEVVILEVYDERQCQNGRLVGIDTTTSATETATSEAISSGRATSAEGSVTKETASTSESIAASSSVAQSQSVGPVSQTTESEASTVASSSVAESIPASLTTSIAASKASTLSPASSSVIGETTTDEVFPTSAPSLVSTTTEAEESTSEEPTSQASSETTETSESSSEESTSAATTEAEQSVTETTTAVEETTTTENETTVEATTESGTESATTTEDATTVVSTTEESSAEETTAEETTTEDQTTVVSTTEESATEETTAEETTTEDLTRIETTTEETTTEETATTETSTAAVPT